MAGRAALRYEDHWRCTYCERWYVVPSLARDCEAKHEEAGE